MADVAGLTEEQVERLKRDLQRQVARAVALLERRLDALGDTESERVSLETARRIATEVADLLERNFGIVSERFERASQAVVDELSDDFARFGLSDAFTAQLGASLRAQVDGTLDRIAEVAKAATSELRTAIIDTVRSGVSPEAAIRALEEKMGGTAAQVASTFDTGLAGFDRTVSAQVATDAGVEWFLYDGPVDDVTRDFCRARVGYRFTLASLDATDNDTGPNPPSVYGGGWGCRHRLVPLVDAEDIAAYPEWT